MGRRRDLAGLWVGGEAVGGVRMHSRVRANVGADAVGVCGER